MKTEVSIDTHQTNKAQIVKDLTKMGYTCRVCTLPRGCGDFFFVCPATGLLVGIEHKTVQDFLNSCKVNDQGERRVVEQVRALLESVDVAILYVEGYAKDKFGKVNLGSKKSGWQYSSYQQMLHTLDRCGIIVEQPQSTGRIAARIDELFTYYNRPESEHTFLSRESKPVRISLSPKSPQTIFYAGIPGVGMDLASSLSKHFVTINELISNPDRLTDVPGIGPKRAASIKEFLGICDTNI